MQSLQFKKFALIMAIMILGSASANAQDAVLPCLPSADVSEVGKVFSQIAQLEKPGKVEYCEADLGPQWYQITRSMVTLKNIKPNEPKEVVDDAFTYKAINEKNWWLYFTARAKAFEVQEKCQDGVVAFVIPFFGDGKVHLCPLYFEQAPSSQASVLMHEVRHFDGFSHVMCTQGLDAGSSGACDKDILDKGSYAISAQTLVAMARSAETAPEDKPMLEAEAMFTVFNRFNIVPKAVINHSVILSNTSGEVFKWNVEDGSLQQLATLPQAARVYSGYNDNVTIYPEDTAVDAYRLDGTFKTSIASIGLFANDYNTLTPEVRKDVQSVTYLGTGGLLNNNTLTTTCGGELLKIDISTHGDFKKIISLSSAAGDSDYTSYVMSQSGELFSFKCNAEVKGELTIEKSALTVEPTLVSLKDVFGLGGKMYALLQTGVLAEVEISNAQIVKLSSTLPFTNKNWVSVSPVTKAEVFKK